MKKTTPNPITPKILAELALEAEVTGSLVLEEEPESVRAMIEESLIGGTDPAEVIPRLLLSAARAQQLATAATVYAYSLSFNPRD